MFVYLFLGYIRFTWTLLPGTETLVGNVSSVVYVSREQRAVFVIVPRNDATEATRITDNVYEVRERTSLGLKSHRKGWYSLLRGGMMSHQRVVLRMANEGRVVLVPSCQMHALPLVHLMSESNLKYALFRLHTPSLNNAYETVIASSGHSAAIELDVVND